LEWLGSGRWQPLPDWARFFAKLGESLAGEPNDAAHTLVVGITLPVRAFAAALVCAGYVTARNVLDPIAPGGGDEYFESLCAQPPGVAVAYTQGDLVHTGQFLGTEMRFGERHLVIEGKRGMQILLPRARAHLVRLTDASASGNPQTRRIDVPPLLSAFQPREDAVAFMTTSRTDVAVVGSIAAISDDLTFTGFGPPKAPAAATSSELQQLVRARGVAAPATGRRVTLVTAHGDSVNEAGDEPRLVVFDGGRAFLRGAGLWPESNRVVLVDRSGPASEPAAELLNSMFVERTGESDALSVEVPASLEGVAFQAAK
jgi:hypothetical protein